MVRYVDPDKMVHPLRLELSQERLEEIAEAIDNDEDWMTMDEIDAIADILFDHIAGLTQNVEGVTTLQ